MLWSTGREPELQTGLLLVIPRASSDYNVIRLHAVGVQRTTLTQITTVDDCGGNKQSSPAYVRLQNEQAQVILYVLVRRDDLRRFLSSDSAKARDATRLRVTDLATIACGSVAISLAKRQIFFQVQKEAVQ